MMTTTTLESRYAEVRQRVADAAVRAGRNPDDVILVAVTKSAEPDQIRTLLHMGHRDLGENRIQQLVQRASMIEELLARRRALPNTPSSRSDNGHATPSSPHAGPPDTVRWHMIGHLQRNKARKAVEFCRLIHSVDSLRLAEEIQQAAVRREQMVDVLIQVNCSGEPNKFGCIMPAARHLAEQIGTMSFVNVRGLMTMAEETQDTDKIRRAFSLCRELFEDIALDPPGQHFNILSMGMSGDFELAIEHGSNMVRVGSAIFGEPSEDQSEEHHAHHPDDGDSAEDADSDD